MNIFAAFDCSLDRFTNVIGMNFGAHVDQDDSLGLRQDGHSETGALLTFLQIIEIQECRIIEKSCAARADIVSKADPGVDERHRRGVYGNRENTAVGLQYFYEDVDLASRIQFRQNSGLERLLEM